MEKTTLQAAIIQECVACVAAWNKDNWDQSVDIPYDDYANQCYNYGGSKLADLFDELFSQSSDEELQDFYSDLSFACERENRGIRSAIGKRIKSIRLQSDMTQQELATAAGITKANVCRVEDGKYSVGIDVLDKIADALGVSLELK
nr:MAG TPA: helix-turn-helix domain protein [Caudoviricetes sp.]